MYIFFPPYKQEKAIFFSHLISNPIFFSHNFPLFALLTLIFFLILHHLSIYTKGERGYFSSGREN